MYIQKNPKNQKNPKTKIKKTNAIKKPKQKPRGNEELKQEREDWWLLDLSAGCGVGGATFYACSKFSLIEKNLIAAECMEG